MTSQEEKNETGRGKGRWKPALTWRSGAASLLIMLGLAFFIQKSTVAMGMESSSEFGLRGLGLSCRNVHELLDSRQIWSMYSAAGNSIQPPYRPEGTCENGQLGWRALIHSIPGKPAKAAARAMQ